MGSWPSWWDWAVELTTHVEQRMEDRGFTEVDLRGMLETARWFREDVVSGRYVILTRHAGRAWEVIVEPDPAERLLVIVTAYAVERWR